MSTTIKVPDNIPVSWLEQLQNLNPDILLLASEPNEDTETQYMSKYLTYGKLVDQVSSDLALGTIHQQISDLSVNSAAIANYLDGTLSLAIDDPYIMSSMTYVISSDNKHFGPLSCSGYRLSAGVSTVFNNIAKCGKDISVVIPQLSSKITCTDNPTENYISSITQQNGSIVSFGYGKFSDIISSKIGSSTKSVDEGYVISSVTTEGGKVTSVGCVNISSQINAMSKVYYRDYTQEETAEDSFNKVDFYIMKLTLSQLQQLSASGKIRQDCVYMTVGDQEN